MNKSLVLTVIVAIAGAMLSISAYAQDNSGQMSALQQKADTLQSQMNETKKQCGANLDGQMKSLTTSIENLVKQRVQLGAQITQLEAQVEELKSSAVASCGRQMKHYQEEMTSVKQQMVDLAAKNAEPAQKADPKTKVAPLQTGQIPPRNK
jgi:chromosome segregation ATPase